ncbi:MAG: FHIPEP family type III secretion protein, partial [Chloroflexi bacterium]|nr:FHIPEP family type III secretion protein [Chloroflexota bacterium]
VSSGELRLPVRRLIALEFPQLPVLSRDELLTQTMEEIENG